MGPCDPRLRVLVVPLYIRMPQRPPQAYLAAAARWAKGQVGHPFPYPLFTIPSPPPAKPQPPALPCCSCARGHHKRRRVTQASPATCGGAAAHASTLSASSTHPPAAATGARNQGFTSVSAFTYKVRWKFLTKSVFGQIWKPHNYHTFNQTCVTVWCSSAPLVTRQV